MTTSPLASSPTTSSSATSIYNNILGENLPFAAALALVPIVVMVGYLLVARKLGPSSTSRSNVTLTRRSTILLRIAVAIGLAFIYIPLLVLGIYAFNASKILEWPPPGLTLEWFPKAIESTAKDAFWTSIKAGLAATAIALVLGTLASLAVSRHRFFGRETISFLVILPIALPGIVTGVALNNTFTQVFGIDLSLFTVIVAHATFCIVVVYNNTIARLRRMSSSLEEASADLGADTWQTFRYVTLPNMRSALGAGGLLAFGLSFDEIIVTTFTIGAGEETLPSGYSRTSSAPRNGR